MSKLNVLLEKYSESHQNQTNKLIHWICVPLIFFSIIGLLSQIPFPFPNQFYINWATIIYIFLLFYYFRLSSVLFMGFVLAGVFIFYIVAQIAVYFDFNVMSNIIFYLAIFILAWIGQFIGHGIEGKKPSFFDDIKFLVIGPAWVLIFFLRKLKINY